MADETKAPQQEETKDVSLAILRNKKCMYSGVLSSSF